MTRRLYLVTAETAPAAPATKPSVEDVGPLLDMLDDLRGVERETAIRWIARRMLDHHKTRGARHADQP